MIDFSTNLEDAVAVLERVSKITGNVYVGKNRMAFLMDILAADGENGNRPIDYKRLLAADDFTFIHDVGGICTHMDRTTGLLGGCFIPRCTLVMAEEIEGA